MATDSASVQLLIITNSLDLLLARLHGCMAFFVLFSCSAQGVRAAVIAILAGAFEDLPLGAFVLVVKFWGLINKTAGRNFN
jgi:hypothetical protein